MYNKGRVITEHFVTLITVKGLLPRMNAVVSAEPGYGSKGFPALPAFVWFLSGVNSVMLDERRALAEGSPALVTLVGLFSSVDSLVVIEG